jgi:hypothetical protein
MPHRGCRPVRRRALHACAHTLAARPSAPYAAQLFDTEDKGYFTKDDLFFVMEAMGGSPSPAVRRLPSTSRVILP